MNSRNLLIRAAILAALVALAGCFKISSRVDAESLSELGSDRILVVGKIELIRPLVEDEQLLKPKGVTHFKNKAFILLGKEAFDLNKIPMRAANDSTGTVTLGKTFFLPVDRGKNLRYSGGFIVMNDYSIFGGNTVGGVLGIWNIAGTDHFTLPGGLKFSPAKSDKAVYIGTIQYYRDDFNAITKINIKDEYAQANAEFKSRYNPRFSLKKLGHEK